MGGHFFLAQYHIRVESAPNTLVIWQPRHWHGTSLQKFSPFDDKPGFYQRGMAFVTSNRLKNVWNRYVWGQLSSDEAQKELAARKEEIFS
jgi:hypothetical protein